MTYDVWILLPAINYPSQPIDADDYIFIETVEADAGEIVAALQVLYPRAIGFWLDSPRPLAEVEDEE